MPIFFAIVNIVQENSCKEDILPAAMSLRQQFNLSKTQGNNVSVKVSFSMQYLSTLLILSYGSHGLLAVVQKYEVV